MILSLVTNDNTLVTLFTYACISLVTNDYPLLTLLASACINLVTDDDPLVTLGIGMHKSSDKWWAPPYPFGKGVHESSDRWWPPPYPFGIGVHESVVDVDVLNLSHARQNFLVRHPAVLIQSQEGVCQWFLCHSSFCEHHITQRSEDINTQQHNLLLEAKLCSFFLMPAYLPAYI